MSTLASSRSDAPPKSPKTHIVPRGLRTAVASFSGLILLWWLASSLNASGESFFPSPAGVWQASVETVQRGLLVDYISVSIGRWAIGVGAGFTAAIVIALVLSLSRTLTDMFFPIINFFHAIVEIAWLPLFVIWFGYSITTIATCIAYVVFFPVLYNTILGLRTVPGNLIAAARTLGAQRITLSREVLLPGSLPGIITGLRLGAGYGWRALVAAEILAAQSGLGYFIFDSRNAGITARIFVGMIVIGIIWMIVDLCYFRPVERATVERWGMVTRES